MRSAARGAHGAYWAAWVDALPVIGVRAPTLAARIVAALGDDAAELPPCLAEARDARARLEAEGMESVPTWEEAAAGARPECSTESSLRSRVSGPTVGNITRAAQATPLSCSMRFCQP